MEDVMTNKELTDFIEHGENGFADFAFTFGDGWAGQAIEIAKELRAALAQPEPEPVAWISTSSAKMIHWTSDKPAYGDDWIPLYTAPQREWVGLTHEEKMEILTRSITAPSRIEVAEALLKEKNT
jgi:hypothetical protein